jgi:signal transduction histidine kinase
VSISVPRELPRVSVDGNAIVQALEIVVDNAIKYSGDAHVLNIDGRVHGKHVRLTVADRGAGVYEDEIEHVFDRFYRGRNAKGNGSGLGLAIARRIVRTNRSEITIRSTVGVGTEVECLLPAAS